MADIRKQILDTLAEEGINMSTVAKRAGLPYPTVYRFLMNGQNSRLDTMYLITEAIEKELTLVAKREEDNE